MSSCPKCGKPKLPRSKKTGFKTCRRCGPILTPQQRTKLLENDPDETEGRKIYRLKADALASAQLAMSQRKVKTKQEKQDG